MPMYEWTGTEWKPTITAQVWNEVPPGWSRAKKIKVWEGSPTPSWVLAWVHPVLNASLSLSAYGVNTGVGYNVTLTAPEGFPEGTSVIFRFTGYSSTVYPAEGSTTATLVGASHASNGTFAWYADVVTKGGTTTFGPVSQTVDVPITTSVTLTGPDWALSNQSGSGGSSSVAAKTFTINLSNPSAVSRLSFQLSHQGGAWTEYQGWNTPPAQVTWSSQFSTPGPWRARAVATLTTSAVVYSAEASLYCYIKHLYASASPNPATSGQTVTLTASHSGDGLLSTSGRWQYMYTVNGVWVDNWSTANPVGWATGGATTIRWRWAENFADGSQILSNDPLVTVNANGIYTDDGSYQGTPGGSGLVNAMFAARNANLPLYVKGTWSLSLNTMWIPDGVSVYCAAGTKFNHTPTARFRNAAAWPATSMPDSCGGYAGGGFFWDGGEFNGGGDGIFTISHSSGFTIQNTRMYNWSSDTGDGHAIEINSSGGADNLNGTSYRVHILNNQFLGLGLGQRTNSNDEAVQWDWAWKGSGCGGAEDHTMCHNIRIAGNTSHRFSEGWDGIQNAGFSLCFTGGHRMSSGSYGLMGNAGVANPSDGYPAERHNWVLIEGNNVHKAVGATSGVSPDKGAIALWSTRDVIVRNNNFYACTDSRLVSGFDETQNLNSSVVNISISGNTHNGAAKTITMPASNTTGG